MNPNKILKLPIGVQLLDLEPHHDERGTFIEVFRQNWSPDAIFLQWNLVHSSPNTLRGVHVHHTHTDYLTAVNGRMTVGLKDLRQQSPTENLAVTVELLAQKPQVLLIPPGVAHGFWFAEAATHLYAVSHYWDTADELGCRFDDLDLGFGWENLTPKLSFKDQHLPSLKTLRQNHPIVYLP